MSQSLPLPNADLSIAFAQKYLQQLAPPESKPVVDFRFLERQRQRFAQELRTMLRSVSARSWNRTEQLLSTELERHGVAPDVIDPWQVSNSIHKVYEFAIKAYAEQASPYRLVTQVSPTLGETRKQVTAIDPRAIGFVAMQFHYTGVQLMGLLPPAEQHNFAAYTKVLDDHLYMPLQRAYDAAARHESNSIALQSVRVLMPKVDQIAEEIVNEVIQLYPRYRCQTGLLSHPQVRTSSIRDVEMFQVYMWVCLLEGNLQALEQELFPLSVMIYPRLNVSWELIRQMIYLLRTKINSYLTVEQAKYCDPYYNILVRLFSPEVFPNA